MSDESPQLAVNSIKFFFFSLYHAPLFTFAVSTQGFLLPMATGISSWWEYEQPRCEQSVRTNVWQKSETSSASLPRGCSCAEPDVEVSSFLSQPLIENRLWWRDETPPALICSLILTWLHTGPQHDPCSLRGCSEQSHWLHFVMRHC